MRAVLLAALLLAGAPALSHAETLAELRWQKRVLVLFAPDENAALRRQRDVLLGDEAALAERDMLVFAVLGSDRILPIYGEAPTGEDAGSLRDRFDVAGDAPFAAVLVGKDGGVKWREDRPVEPAELNGVVDAMPMRRSGR